MRRLAIAVLVLMPFAPARAEAITIRDIIELTRAGLGDDVLLALIEVDGSVFSIDTATLTKLKESGVSERVIVAMIRSGRSRVAEEAQVSAENPPPAEPLVVVPPPPMEIVREVVVPVPVYVTVPVPTRGGHRVIHEPFDQIDHYPDQRGTGFKTDIPPSRKSESVYWGWGGKLRPDAWKPR